MITIKAGPQFKWAFQMKNKSMIRYPILLALLVVFIPLANAKDAANEKSGPTMRRSFDEGSYRKPCNG